MRIKFFALCAALLMLNLPGRAQSNHQEAKKWLTQARQELQSHPQLFLSFDYHFENTRVDPPVTQEEKGSIALQGDNYHLSIMNMQQIRNGDKLYTILPEDEEVQITDYDAEEDQGLTPSSILQSFDKGYSYKLGGTETHNGRKLQYVILKPNASEEIDRIIVGIDTQSKQLVVLKQWGTNGTVTTFTITGYEPQKELPEGHFSFDRSDYPGYYIAD